ncbi:DUF4250 domain-containing protein [Faecalimonas sp.]
MTNLPKDAFLLLSVLNTKLRDYYGSLDALCEDMNEDKTDIVRKLENLGYEYDEGTNQFV